MDFFEIESFIKSRMLAEFNIQTSSEQALTGQSFLDLGLDSMNYIRLILMIENEYGIEIDDNYLVPQDNNIRNLAEFIGSQLASA